MRVEQLEATHQGRVRTERVWRRTMTPLSRTWSRSFERSSRLCVAEGRRARRRRACEEEGT